LFCSIVAKKKRERRRQVERAQPIASSFFAGYGLLERACIDVALSVVTDDWQFEVLALEAVDHQHNPADELNKVCESADWSADKGYELCNKPDYGQCTKEYDRLHRMEAHKAVLLLHQEEDQSGEPTEQIAQASGYILIQSHRSWGSTGRPVLLLAVRILPVVWLLIVALLIAALLAILLAAVGVGWLGLWWCVAATIAGSWVLVLLIRVLSLVAHDNNPLFI